MIFVGVIANQFKIYMLKILFLINNSEYNYQVLPQALSCHIQCDFQVIYASGIKGKAGLTPEKLGDDLGPLFESIIRCIPGPRINKDGALQMLVSDCSLFLLYAFVTHSQFLDA